MSSARRPLVAGNWKMHKTGPEAREFCAALAALVSEMPAVDVAVCPPYTALEASASALAGSPIAVYAQNVHENEMGAHTGDISSAMILATGADGSLVGHSECRAEGDTDAQIALRVRNAIDAGLMVVLCCGESLRTRQAGQTEAWLTGQIRSALEHVQAGDIAHLVIAYEPIWAIGTGETASPAQAQEACAIVRRVASETIDGEALRVLYGGSVSAANAVELMSQPDVDGALVGGASLETGAFAAIVAAAG
ncbi:MAG: triose-phosphate isomerase [Thermoleophilia bacterium]|nr:triose-phosphate isomerase [Thermoleophilia bacterium]